MHKMIWFDSGKDCMEEFCNILKENDKETINFKLQEMKQ